MYYWFPYPQDQSIIGYIALLLIKRYIAITHDILTEYEEQLSNHWNTEVAINVTRSLTELSTALLTVVYYNLDLIVADKDDNKFVACAFAANADFIITNDTHFNILKTIDFPSIPILSIDKFKGLLIKNGIL
jgi:putative PIN family toxin of toxin-antitoxin system